MQLTQNFTLEEMISSSTGNRLNIQNVPSQKEIEKIRELCEKILQPVRTKYGKPIRVTSGFRSPAINNAVKGSSTSQHLKGEAADIVCENNRNLWNLICGMIQGGEIIVGQLIDEKNLKWIHISLPSETQRNRILHL